MAKYEIKKMKNLLNITKALSDENRIRALYALKEQELCVCQIVELLQFAPSTVSKHLSLLRQAGLIESRKEGRWIYYRLASEEIEGMAENTLKWFFDNTEGIRKLQKDAKRLKEILSLDPEELCCKQNEKENRDGK